jgi:hypothetical protein
MENEIIEISANDLQARTVAVDWCAMNAHSTFTQAITSRQRRVLSDLPKQFGREFPRPMSLKRIACHYAI